MTMLRRLRSGARENRGGVLAFVALFAPIAVLLAAFVIDLGNGWWHQRHLQVQADAAALSAAQDMGTPSCVTNLPTDVQAYGGVAGTTTYNRQVGGTASANIQQAINSRTFPWQSSPVDSTVSTGSPCSSGMVDVKMTEKDLPFFLPVFSSVFNKFSYINAQARVQLFNESISANSLPVAVNDVHFAYAEAYFINENTGTVLPNGAVRLGDTGASNGLDMWTSAATPFSLTLPNDPAPTGTTFPDSDVGVRIALSGVTPPTGNMATDCATSGTLCFDGSSANAQLVDVHGYKQSGTGSPTAPVNHGVVLTPLSGCDQYYTAATSSCTDALQATLDIGNSLNGVTVNAVVGGNTYQLTCPNPTGNPKLTTCTSPTAGIPIAAGSGRNQVDVKVVFSQGQGNNKTTTTTTIANAQSTYAGAGTPATSGPIQSLSIVRNVNGLDTTDQGSLQEGTPTPYQVWVNLGITPSVSIGQATDPPVTMRLDGVGSQNQSIQCAPNAQPSGLPSDTWLDAIATGCQGPPPQQGNGPAPGPFQLNPTLGCPDTIFDCVTPATGNQTNKVAKALNYRILGSTSPSGCTAPNHWPNYKASDPRIVSVLITPYDSFSGNGTSTSYPIQSFAAFYVTGWQGQGQGNTNPCQPPSQPPLGGVADDTAAAGTMVGHFIHYVQFLNDGGGGTQTCVPGSLNECVAVMTR